MFPEVVVNLGEKKVMRELGVQRKVTQGRMISSCRDIELTILNERSNICLTAENSLVAHVVCGIVRHIFRKISTTSDSGHLVSNAVPVC